MNSNKIGCDPDKTGCAHRTAVAPRPLHFWTACQWQSWSSYMYLSETCTFYRVWKDLRSLRAAQQEGPVHYNIGCDPPPQNWMRPYDNCSSAPTALMKKLSTANLLSIHVLILRIFVFGGATRIVGAGSCQSQIWLCTVVLLANPLPGASGLEKLTRILM